MEVINPVLRSIVSDLFVNLSAGWVGAIIITPNFSDTTGLKKWVVLTGNLIGVIVSLLIAFSLRSSL
ncbi:hypothetical protein A3F00_01935 [Candidatus Daviesbacteria bacterium RIFCSPHIGHO2_12_FULL_37_11]|uniref:Uncharacterized protein n=1 Tax=Candidatus Daviesbacteria bacterium RIFCSPHIGHO2_12_FULL_37_11 TaxID=1797777 RepID=A0A1F5KDI4_9BACT|nr:MAG: hypothetical protein A2111_03225 [Candidatus Daviesbacteria bacterium GWA1_38_6]OGE17650.1 MAG: hypothetical protein A2769_04030 [Candidatus Daviesbacteria bacterium RIFCSPHIGHO2_01_FULL_37_27]OGE38948.1 MAG: hypothetical protein A3F00_01935 [Candidatus Daviesbacteria bacterium RIFCSPHIGHO2_12_FULL_37_11]OGE46161.1 MAG: hypothetical protein A3B39_02075 [Candidatus Daviesbacteria bacterium RIFCSPLOWO2_01_FULL_37_10]